MTGAIDPEWIPTPGYARTRDGVSIAYCDVGTGPGFVLMPGVPFSDFVAEWRIPVVRRAYGALADDVRLIQYDGRGTGHSQRDVADVSLTAMIADLDAVVAARGLARFSLLGFYNSSTTALAYAARHPDRVRSLVLFGGTARGWTPMSGTETQALLSLIERDWDTFVESITHAWLGWPPGDEGRLAAEWFRNATTPDVARATLRAASATDVTADLPAIRCPVLVLHRADAHVVSLEASQELAAALPDGRLEILPGSSASLFFEAADDVIARIVRFVTGRPPAEPLRTSVSSANAVGSALTPRETDVLRRIAAGDTNADIARRLGISINTVERHTTNLYRKIEARGRADATAFAIRHGIA